MEAAKTTTKKDQGFFQGVWSGFKSLPVWGQVTIVIVLILIIWRATSGILKTIAAKKVVADIKQEQDAFVNAGQVLTYPVSNYKIFADQIYNAMNYSGTDTEEIERVFSKMNNDLDVLELNKAFGKRDIYFWGFTYSYTLGEALADEMDVSTINSDLSAKGIKFQY